MFFGLPDDLVQAVQKIWVHWVKPPTMRSQAKPSRHVVSATEYVQRKPAAGRRLLAIHRALSCATPSLSYHKINERDTLGKLKSRDCDKPRRAQSAYSMRCRRLAGRRAGNCSSQSISAMAGVNLGVLCLCNTQFTTFGVLWLVRYALD